MDILTGEHPNFVTYEIKNIIDVPHFVEKKGAPLLQLADACAFSFRRCLAKQVHGNELVMSMLGPNEGAHFVGEPLWFEETSSGVFNTEAYWNDDLRQQEQRRIAAFNAAQAFAEGVE